MYAVVLLSFAWAVYPFVAHALGLERLFPRWLESLPAQAADLIGLAVLCLISSYLPAGFQVFWNALEIHRATSSMIADIRQKYTALFEQALRNERQRIFAGLQDALSTWALRIKARQAVFEQTATLLKIDLTGDNAISPFFNEERINDPFLLEQTKIKVDVNELKDQATRFLLLPENATWNTQKAEDLKANLQHFASSQLQVGSHHLDLVTWLEEKSQMNEERNSFAARMATLSKRARPAFPLSRQERSPLVASHLNLQASGVIQMTFAGLPTSAKGIHAYQFGPSWAGETFPATNLVAWH